MIQKLCNRIDPIFAGRATGYDNAFAALRD